MNKLNPFAGRTKGRSWFWWGINIGVLIGIMAWLWWRENQPEGEVKTVFKFKPAVTPEAEPDHQITIDEQTADEPAAEPDSLKVIEGIGPKSAQALEGAGINTFAALAAAGKWEALKELQGKLVGGRRV
jgi:hypothetical protein